MDKKIASIFKITQKTPKKLYVEVGCDHVPKQQVCSSVPCGYFIGKLWEAVIQWKEHELQNQTELSLNPCSFIFPETLTLTKSLYLKPLCPHQTEKLFNMKIYKISSTAAGKARGGFKNIP